ncbi:putative Kunitz-type serine protease inhibitor [Lucilia cuprina]|uniref:putative Kunitz-type serine protease inhibitor n=1 Tax=Lucilia cuprina TaxID=7375 RepID=UPI001F052896|nr:putative Kunitz-type serine protease inhibitor [Lucilia cuprina]
MFFCAKLYILIILTIFSSLLISVNDAVDNDKKQDPKCLLPMEPGPCRMSLDRFYYNAQTDTCEQFKFGGCKGNDNKFGFKQTCEAACKKSTTTTATAAAGKSTATSTTTESSRFINKQLKSDTLKTLATSAAVASTTTPKPLAARTTVKTKTTTARSGTTTTQKSNNRF